MRKRKEEIQKRFILGPEDEAELKAQIMELKRGDPEQIAAILRLAEEEKNNANSKLDEVLALRKKQ